MHGEIKERYVEMEVERQMTRNKLVSDSPTSKLLTDLGEHLVKKEWDSRTNWEHWKLDKDKWYVIFKDTRSTDEADLYKSDESSIGEDEGNTEALQDNDSDKENEWAKSEETP